MATHRYGRSLVGAALAILYLAGMGWTAEENDESPSSLVKQDLDVQDGTATLRWKLQPGASFRYRMEQQMDVPAAGRVPAQSAMLGMDVSWTVVAVNDAGIADMRLTIDRIRMKTNSVSSASDIDTARPAKDALEELMLEGTQPLLEAEFGFRLSPRGESSDFTQPEEVENLRGALSGADSNSPIEVLKQVLALLAPTLPEAALSSGDTWEHAAQARIGEDGSKSIDLDLTYRGTVERASLPLHVVDFVPQIEMSAIRGGLIRIRSVTKEGEGRLLFDNEAGRLVEFEVVELADMEMSLGADKKTTQMTNRVAARLLTENEPVDEGAP